MPAISAYNVKNMLDWQLGGATATQPASRLVALSLGTPTSVSGSEVGTGSGYSRATVTFAAAASPAGPASNLNSLDFGPPASGQFRSHPPRRHPSVFHFGQHRRELTSALRCFGPISWSQPISAISAEPDAASFGRLGLGVLRKPARRHSSGQSKTLKQTNSLTPARSMARCGCGFS
jgi:hypothetical protein